MARNYIMIKMLISFDIDNITICVKVKRVNVPGLSSSVSTMTTNNVLYFLMVSAQSALYGFMTIVIII